MNKRRSISGRRSAALLIVLASMVLVVTASASIARVAVSTKQRIQFQSRVLVADDLLRAAESPILHWLKTRSQSVVLAPENSMPVIEVLHDRMLDTDSVITIRITGFDQCGMSPLAAVRSGSVLRTFLPTDVVSAVDRIQLESDQLPGLDLFGHGEWSEDLKVFPRLGAFRPAPPTIGAVIATHNPGLLNVNTAPIGLIESTMRSKGVGGLEQIIVARNNGKSAVAPTSEVASRSGQASAIQFVSSSSVWSFRIDINVGALQRSWWSVYTQGSNEWECVQRLAITE